MAAGNELFGRHFDAVHRFFVNKIDRGVEDLVQRTFAACVEAKGRFREESAFRTFLLGIANNMLRERYRKRRRDPVDFESHSALDLGAGPSSVVAAKQEERILLEALRRIPLDFQVALELYFWEDMTGAEVGEILGIPENTARSRVRRGKELLAKAIQRIEASPELLDSTSADLEGWAALVRERVAASAN